jgi:hypothetical protein
MCMRRSTGWKLSVTDECYIFNPFLVYKVLHVLFLVIFYAYLLERVAVVGIIEN